MADFPNIPIDVTAQEIEDLIKNPIPDDKLERAYMGYCVTSRIKSFSELNNYLTSSDELDANSAFYKLAFDESFPKYGLLGDANYIGFVSDRLVEDNPKLIIINTENFEMWSYVKNSGEFNEVLSEDTEDIIRLTENSKDLESLSSVHNGYLVNINKNCVFACSTSQWKDVPANSVFINRRYSTHYNIQTVTVLSTGVEYTRIVDRRGETITDENVNDKYKSKLYKEQDWKQISDLRLIENTDELDAFSETHKGYLVNVNENCILVGHKSRYKDTPLGVDGIFTNRRYSTYYNIQTFTVVSTGAKYERIVDRRGEATTDEEYKSKLYRDWWQIGASDTNPQLKILALGDSICRGARNDEKGFVGDLGMPYKNIGVSGATVSNVRTDVTNIPDQLVNEAEYQPDIIIANGGVNDYYKNAKMGILSDVPVSTNAEAEALDRSTLLGGLEYLFYTMISLHPKAQRFFLITHKTYAPTLTQTYWTTTPNQAGYTQQEMHDAIVECCNAYNVKVIDVYNDSMMNTLFSEYRSTESWSGNTAENKIEITNNNYCDADGIHPLALGYKECYVPLVKQAIGIGTVK